MVAIPTYIASNNGVSIDISRPSKAFYDPIDCLLTFSFSETFTILQGSSGRAPGVFTTTNAEKMARMAESGNRHEIFWKCVAYRTACVHGNTVLCNVCGFKQPARSVELPDDVDRRDVEQQ